MLIPTHTYVPRTDTHHWLGTAVLHRLPHRQECETRGGMGQGHNHLSQHKLTCNGARHTHTGLLLHTCSGYQEEGPSTDWGGQVGWTGWLLQRMQHTVEGGESHIKAFTNTCMHACMHTHTHTATTPSPHWNAMDWNAVPLVHQFVGHSLSLQRTGGCLGLSVPVSPSLLHASCLTVAKLTINHSQGRQHTWWREGRVTCMHTDTQTDTHMQAYIHHSIHHTHHTHMHTTQTHTLQQPLGWSVSSTH